jgi:hypothetical protein
MNRKTSKRHESLIPQERIESKIYLIRGKRVMLDRDLASLYGVETRVFKQAVKRNIERFPADFMFQLTRQEKAEVITICDNPESIKFSPANPDVFTEQGVAMLSSVLNSKRAVQANIQIIRVFTRLRELMISHKDLARKIADLERKFKVHDEAIVRILQAIRI